MLRGTNDTINPALHLVSLFAVDSGILLAQQPVEDKSNEITAIPKILDQIDIRGAVITIDAMGCQKSIAKKICDQGADYVLALKGNAGLIYDEVVQYFKEAEENLAIFRRLALNILGSGKGLLERRKKAAWNEEYLTEIISKLFIKSF